MYLKSTCKIHNLHFIKNKIVYIKYTNPCVPRNLNILFEGDVMNKLIMIVLLACIGFLGGCGGGGDHTPHQQNPTTPVVVNPPFTVSTNPVTQNVPRNGQDIKVGDFLITANEPLSVTRFELIRTGFGNPAEILSLHPDEANKSGSYNYDRVTGKATLDVNIGVPKNGEKKFSLFAYLSGIANSQHSFALTSITVNGKIYAMNSNIGLLNITSYIVPEAKTWVDIRPLGLNTGSLVAWLDLFSAPDRNWVIKQINLSVKILNNGNPPIPMELCLRDKGSRTTCGSDGTTTNFFTISGNSTVVFPISVENSRLHTSPTLLSNQPYTTQLDVVLGDGFGWKSGDIVSISVDSIKYRDPSTGYIQTKSFVGLANATTTLVK